MSVGRLYRAATRHNKSGSNNKWEYICLDPLRAKKAFIRKKYGPVTLQYLANGARG